MTQKYLEDDFDTKEETVTVVGGRDTADGKVKSIPIDGGVIPVAFAGSPPSFPSVVVLRDKTVSSQQAAIDVDGNLQTDVNNFPASFQVSNFPASTQVSNFPANQDISVRDIQPRVEVYYQVAANVYKLKYFCIAPPGTALGAASWEVWKFVWQDVKESPDTASSWKRTSIRYKSGIKIADNAVVTNSESDTDPWRLVRQYLDTLVWSL